MPIDSFLTDFEFIHEYIPVQASIGQIGICLLCKNIYASRLIKHVHFHPIPKHISITIQQALGYAPSHSLPHDFEKVSLLTCVYFAIHGRSH